MNRRDLMHRLIALIGCMASPQLSGVANAQQPGSPRRVGVLLGGLSVDSAQAHAFAEGLESAGYAPGREVIVEWVSSMGDYTRVPALAAKLVADKVDVIVVGGTQDAQAAKRATSRIPIVMVVVSDPIGSGLVQSLSRPGGNITGLTIMTPDLSAKRMQLLKECMPQLRRVAVLWNPDTPFHHNVMREIKETASSLGMQPTFIPARRPDEFDAAFSAMRRARAQLLYVIDDSFFFSQRRRLLEAANRLRIPVIYAAREFAHEGSLMYYGADLIDQFRRSATYVDRILRGANPGDLPIEQPTKFELVLNLKTAKTLGITFPESLLLRADEVIR